MNLYLLNENITNGFHSVTLNFVTFAAILCGIFVIVSKNPIVSVLFLIGLFLSISIYLMLLGINFIGLSYLLVYVGAISILFLFILMLINIRISEIISSTSNSIPLAIIIGTLFFSTVYQALPLANTIMAGSALYSNKDYNAITPGFAIIKDEINKYLYSLYDLFNGITLSPATNFTSRYYEYKDQSLEFVSSQA
jgi:NADH-ubiquinone oxidoreductase chain 6